MRYSIKNKNGEVLVGINSLDYQGEWMGERYITTSINSPTPIEFSLGDYIEYNGERFELNVLPSDQKQASIGSVGNAFVYDNIKFSSLTDELVRCLFLNYAQKDGSTEFMGNSVFSMFCPDVSYLARAIQANLDRLYGEDVWSISVDDSYLPSEDGVNVNLSFENNTCWEALAKVEEFDTKFIIDKTTRTITIGVDGDTIRVFQFGRGNGLRNIKRKSDSQQNIVTRIRAYGNTTNMPTHYYYYKSLHPVWYATEVFYGQTKISQLPFLYQYYYYAKFPLTQPYPMFPNPVSGTTNWYICTFEVTYPDGTKSNTATNVAYADGYGYVQIAQTKGPTYAGKTLGPKDIKIEFTSGINKQLVPYGNKEFDVQNPNRLLLAERLMLPSFPTTADPYIDSTNIDELGVREACVYFDGTNDNDDIYPTLEEVTMKDLQDAGYTVYKATEDSSKQLKNIRIDAILGKSKRWETDFDKAEDYNNAGDLNDDGVFDTDYNFTDTESHFIVKLRNIGFDLKNADIKISADTYPVLSMKDGMCGGREFNIVNSVESTDHTYYTIVCEKAKDESLGIWFPNKDSYIAKEDKFVLTNMNMPDMYIQTASARLRASAIAWLAENDVTSFKYEVEIDNIYIARDHETNGNNSIYSTIKEGDQMWLKDTDLDIDTIIPIEKLSIKVGTKDIPKLSVSLNDEKTVGTLTRIQNAIKGITNGTIQIRNGGGMNSNQVKDLFNQMIANLKLDETYLNKNTDDIAKGNYEFQGNIVWGDQTDDNKKYIQNIQGGKMYWNGSGWCFDTDYLNVTKKASFKELEIQKVTHIGGQQLLTACGGKIDHVVSSYGTSTDYHYIFFSKKDADGNAVTDDWKVGDLVYCQSFNVGRGTTTDVGSRYYWVRVISKEAPAPATGKTTLTSNTGEEFDPNDYYCLRFRYNSSSSYSDHPSSNATTPCANTSKTNCDIPIKGDNVVQFGHIKQASETDAEAEARQGATLLAGAGNWGQALLMWRGIGSNTSNPFLMPTPRVEIGPKKVNIQADNIKLASNGLLELSSNQLKCTNKDGDMTAYLDELGNFITSGIQDQMVQQVNDVESFLERFICIPGENTINPIDQDNLGYDGTTWKQYNDSQGSVYLYDDAYKVAKVDDLEDSVKTTAISPCSDVDLVYNPGQYEFGNRTSNIQTCLDMRCAEGIIEINWLPLKTSNWNTSNQEPFIGIYLPFFQNYGYDITNMRWETHYLRTPTRMNMKTSFIDLVQMNSLVGRKFTLVNNTKGLIKVMYDPNFANRVILQPDDYITFEFVGEVRQGSLDLQYYNEDGELVTRPNVSIGEFMWKPLDDESFLNVRETSLDDTNFSTTFEI